METPEYEVGTKLHALTLAGDAVTWEYRGKNPETGMHVIRGKVTEYEITGAELRALFTPAKEDKKEAA